MLKYHVKTKNLNKKKEWNCDRKGRRHKSILQKTLR